VIGESLTSAGHVYKLGDNSIEEEIYSFFDALAGGLNKR
jgi:hypothetical protein